MNPFKRIKEELQKIIDVSYYKTVDGTPYAGIRNLAYHKVLEAVEQVEKEYNNGWIPCSERLPKVETEVLILAKRKIRDGYFRYIITTAMYEDGTVSKSDSRWYWYDIECEYDKENDCYVVPEGWREIKHYNFYNNQVDDEVIAWQPLPVPYKEANNDRY